MRTADFVFIMQQRFAFVSGQKQGTFADIRPLLVLSLQFYAGVRIIVNADAEFVADLDPARFFLYRRIERIIIV